MTQLGCGYLDAGLLRADALLIEHCRPTAGLDWQEDDRRELPAIADRLAALGQVRLVDHGAIGRGLRLRTLDTGGVDAQPHPFLVGRPQQIPHKDLAQPPLVNLPVFEGFIQATPASFKGGRERQFRERVRLRLGQQRIHAIEQGVSRSVKTAVDLLTKALQCVKVHLSNAPVCDLPEHYSLGQSFV